MYDYDIVVGHITKDIVRIGHLTKKMPGGTAFYFSNGLAKSALKFFDHKISQKR